MGYAAVSMGLFIFILAYFTFNAPKTVPKPEEPEVQISEFCEKVDPATAPTFKAPADNATKTGSEDDLSLGDPIFNPDCKADGPNHQFSRELTTYRLLMKNVPLTKTEEKHHSENFVGESCHFDTADELGIDISGIDTSEFKVFFPQISGEISLGRVHPSRTRGGEGEKTLMYFIDYGLVFFIHTKPDGTMTEVKGGTTQGASENFVLADIYQDIESPGRDGMPEEAFTCNTTKGAQIASGKQVLLPEQNISTDSGQLQLQYFVFGTGASSGQVVNGWGIHCKPAVYLYPPKKQLVNVRVNPKGELSYTDPPYDPLSGWTVNAFPSGQLLNIDNQQISNNYLYYESKLFAKFPGGKGHFLFVRDDKDFFSYNPPFSLLEGVQLKHGLDRIIRPKDLAIKRHLGKLEFASAKTVLDFGCADGIWLERLLAGNQKTGLGVDIAQKLIDIAKTRKARKGKYFMTMDKWPIKENSVDFSVSFDTFEHIEDKKHEASKVYRSLKPGGKFLFFQLNHNNKYTFDWIFESLGSDALYRRADHHREIFPVPDQFAKTLTKIGFRNVKYELYDGPANLFWDVFCYSYLSVLERILSLVGLSILMNPVIIINTWVIYLLSPLNFLIDKPFVSRGYSNGFFVWGEK